MTFPLTADICAHGIVAAARYLGVDPVHAMTAKRGPARSAFTAAALAAESLTGLKRVVIGRVFGVLPNSLSRCDREGSKAFDRARAAASTAMVAAGAGLADTAPPMARAAPGGTVVAPPPVAQPLPVPAPAPAPVKVDHTAAIAEALARRRARRDVWPFAVVGVEADKALIGATEPGGCVWPMGDPRDADYRSCQAAPLAGRMYCAEHLKKAGMKPVPKVIETVGRVARSYVDREAG